MVYGSKKWTFRQTLVAKYKNFVKRESQHCNEEIVGIFIGPGPSPIIIVYPWKWLFWLSHCSCWNLTDTTLWKSKLFDAVFVADVGEEECVDNNLVEILKLNFRRDSKSEFWPKYRRFWNKFWARFGAKIWSNFLSCNLGKILKLSVLLRFLGLIWSRF